MSRKSVLHIGLVGLLGALALGAIIFTIYINQLPNFVSQHETIILGQSQVAPGSRVALRVLVRDSKDAALLKGAHIKVSLKPGAGGDPIALFGGETDEQGIADVQFDIPEDMEGEQTLLLETSSTLGSDYVERPVTIEREQRLLLTTDKPIYQPGQVIHMRVLALNNFDQRAAARQEVEFVVADGKGNKVFRQRQATSEFGIAATDFVLADEVNAGDYKISAILGETTSEKTVSVKRYVLPKFEVTVSTDRSYYLPGQRVQGTLQAAYFYGKPVSSGRVLIQGYTFDVERSDAFSLQGQTDQQGEFTFEFDMPDFLTGSELEGGLGRFYLEASVVDQANHSESTNQSLPVAGEALLIEAIPESGQFRPGVENILYVLTSYPDGTPAETSLAASSNGWSGSAQTGPYGLAELRLMPGGDAIYVEIQAQDSSGNRTLRQFQFEADHQAPISEGRVLVRPDRPAYQVGEIMNLTVLSSRPRGTVYIDMVRERQTVSTRSVEVSDGRAEVAVDLTPDLVGTLELHAYKILDSGDIVRDTRLVVVDDAESLQVGLLPVCSPESAAGDVACVYHPGDKMGLDIRVSDAQGNPAHSALGLAIVDESVFALAEQDPGFERLYFLLEQELMQPKYDIHGFSLPELIIEKPSGEEALIQAYQGAAFASLADATPQQGLFGLHANSHEETIERLNSRQDDYYSRLGDLLGLSNSLVALFIAGLGAVVLWRRKQFWTNLGCGLGIWVLIIFAGFFIGISTSGDFLLFLGFCLAAAGLAGMIGLLIVAIRQKERLLGWILGLSLYYALTIFLFNYVADQSYPSDGAVLATFLPLVFVILILTALIIGVGFKALRGKGTSAGLTSILLLAIFLTRCSPAMPQMAMQTQIVTEKIYAEREKDTAAPEAGEPPRLRQYFPETLLWLPEALTDENGFLHLDILAADSITTWRMTALASTQDGRLGSASGGMRVFQDFFIDLDLPMALTVGDEVSIPVGVFNYLPEEQNVRLELQPQEWFELLDQPVKEVRIAANDIDVAYFRVRATQFGRQPFQVTAWGSQMSDAILKEVQVYPNGQQVSFSRSDFLKPGSAETPGGAIETILIPSVAITGTQALLVKIYPGIFSQVVEGLESMLRMPSGCFEQTSSTTYPNVLVLAYLKATEQISPEVQFKAENYINTGYQRLVSFEVGNSGGFSLFGYPPADRMLTAFGLLEFSDMSRVHDVDPAILQRAADWLFANQLEDGSWENDRGLYHEEAWQSLQNDRLPVTAYIVWSLVEAGFGEDARAQKGLSYLRERQAEAEAPYVTALLANALVAADLQGKEISSATQQVLDRLAEQAIREKENAYWASGIDTFMGGSGLPGDIETTSLAALAFIRAGAHTELANAALTYLVQNKDSFGTWFSTHATVMALKALIESVRGGSQTAQAEVTVLLNGSQVGEVQVNPDNFDVLQLISLADFDLGSENTLELRMRGSGRLMYQVTGSYYLPWEQIAAQPELVGGEELVEINVDYDRTELSVEESVQVNVKVALNQPGTATSMLVDLGLPPGFSVQTEDLDALVAQSSDQPEDSAMPIIERYELAGRQIIFYISNLSFANPLEFSFGLKARYPLRAQTPASNAYDYYNPQVSGLVAPEILVVNP